MGLNFDDIKNKAKDALKEHGDKIEQGLDKAGDFAKDKFGGQHSEKIDQATGKAKEFLDRNRGEGGQPGEQPAPPQAQ